MFTDRHHRLRRVSHYSPGEALYIIASKYVEVDVVINEKHIVFPFNTMFKAYNLRDAHASPTGNKTIHEPEYLSLYCMCTPQILQCHF